MPGSDETAVVAVIARRTSALARGRRRGVGRGRGDPADQPGRAAAERDRLLDAAAPDPCRSTADGRRAVPGGIPAPADTAAIVVTSGTTAEPKGVELTRAGMEVMGRGYSAGLDADDRRSLARLPAAAPRRQPRRRSRARTSPASPWTVHDALRPRPRRARAARRRRDDRVASSRRRCCGCSTRARRCTSTGA